MEIFIHLIRLFIWLGRKATAAGSPGSPLRAEDLAKRERLLRRGAGPKAAAPACNPIWQRDDHLT